MEQYPAQPFSILDNRSASALHFPGGWCAVPGIEPSVCSFYYEYQLHARRYFAYGARFLQTEERRYPLRLWNCRRVRKPDCGCYFGAERESYAGPAHAPRNPGERTLSRDHIS